MHELETSGREVPSATIGTKVLEKLREIDEVAYLRYASVHRRFEDVDNLSMPSRRSAAGSNRTRFSPNCSSRRWRRRNASGAAGARETTKVKHGRV